MWICGRGIGKFLHPLRHVLVADYHTVVLTHQDLELPPIQELRFFVRAHQALLAQLSLHLNIMMNIDPETTKPRDARSI
jgi:hypothetical protein